MPTTVCDNKSAVSMVSHCSENSAHHELMDFEYFENVRKAKELRKRRDRSNDDDPGERLPKKVKRMKEKMGW